MTTFAEFKVTVSDTLNRGTTLDTALDTRVRQAIRWFERLRKYSYMYEWTAFTIDASASPDPRLLTLPSRVRSWDFFRILLGSGTAFDYKRLRQINPLDVTRLEITRPEGFWFNSNIQIVLSSTPKEDYSAEYAYWAYTDQDAIGDDDTHWLIDNAEDAVLARTMLLMAPYMREDTKFFQMYKALLDDALIGLEIAESEFEHGSSEQIQIGVYTG